MKPLDAHGFVILAIMLYTVKCTIYYMFARAAARLNKIQSS